MKLLVQKEMGINIIEVLYYSHYDSNPVRINFPLIELPALKGRYITAQGNALGNAINN